MSKQDFETLKVVLIGESGVGKTSLIVQYVNNSFNAFNQPTIGGSFCNKTIVCDDNKIVKLEIWDTAGQERYHSIANIFYQNAQVALLVYDIAVEESFNKIVNYWAEEVRKGIKENALIAIIGNKNDLCVEDPNNEKVKEDEARDFAKSINALYFKSSAKNHEMVRDIFETVTKKYFGYKKAKTEEDDNNNTDLPKKKDEKQIKLEAPKGTKKKKCC